MDALTFHNNQEPALNENAVNHFLQDQNVTDTYDNTKTYAVGDYCINENKLYKCTTAITTAEDFTAEHWNATTMIAEINAKIKDLTDKIDTLESDTTTSANNLQKQIYKVMNLNDDGTIDTTKAWYQDPVTYEKMSVQNDGTTFGKIYTK